MASLPTDAEIGAAYAAGKRILARWPQVPYSEQLKYLDWVGELLERTVAASPSSRTRASARHELYHLRYMQRQVADEAREQARSAVLGFDAQARRAQLQGGERRRG